MSFDDAIQAYYARGEEQGWLGRAIGRIEAEPSMLGASPHLLVVARR